jgi:hypothetical protein
MDSLKEWWDVNGPEIPERPGTPLSAFLLSTALNRYTNTCDLKEALALPKELA